MTRPDRPTTPVPAPDPAEAGLAACREIARWSATLARLSAADLAAALRLYRAEASPVDWSRVRLAAALSRVVAPSTSSSPSSPVTNTPGDFDA